MQPSNATVTIDGSKFNALATHVGISTHHDEHGMPLMGSLKCDIIVTVDMHDDENMPFSTLNKLYDMATLVTRDKIKDIKIEFWRDESQQDALCLQIQRLVESLQHEQRIRSEPHIKNRDSSGIE